MVILGITGRRRNAASALAVDGRVVAAVSEASVTRVPRAGCRESGFPIASAAECLRLAGIGPREVARVVSASGGGGSTAPGAPRHSGTGAERARRAIARSGLAPLADLDVLPIGRALAHAWQAAGLQAPGLALVVDIGPTWTPGGPARSDAAALFRLGGGAPVLVRTLPGLAALFTTLAATAERLGWADDGETGTLDFLESLAAGDGEAAPSAVVDALRLADDDAAVHTEAFAAGLRAADAEAGGALADASSPNVHVQRARAALAGAVLARAATLVVELRARWGGAAGAPPVALAGEAFACPTFTARLRARGGDDVIVVPVPEREGCALGAALAGFDNPQSGTLDGVTLGPTFSEAEAKAALENARLDYLYEPSWDRLLTRVSRLLARGKLIGWFQEAAEFGPRSLGGRSVVCDPSDRYVRENVNRFLKQRHDHAPLPISILAEAAGEWLEDGAASPWMLWRSRVRQQYRDKLRSAIDGNGCVTYHTVTGTPHQALADLMRMHASRTGVPALVNTTLAGPGEPTALTPRDAIRCAYSSSVDALVLQRFVVMKDYWLLRSETE
jgi:predicted NodU family carbamoyl transferase